MTINVLIVLIGYGIGCFALERAEDSGNAKPSAHALLVASLFLMAVAGARVGYLAVCA